jgi:ketosteroid isomerase-like protein
MSATDWRTAVTSSTHENRNRDFLRGLYVASFAGEVDAFPKAMAHDFEAHVPPLLPWGGVHRGPDEFANVVLPQLAVAIDFGSMRLESISADGDRVAALLKARTTLGADLWMAEHWVVGDGKLQQLRVFCDDTRPLESHRAATAS